jgi:catechol 2,3-dioxygenase
MNPNPASAVTDARANAALANAAARNAAVANAVARNAAVARTAAVTNKDLLAPDTAMAAVTLHVGDLDGMTAYYRDVLALNVLDLPAPTVGILPAHPTATVTLGRGTTPLVVLRHTPDLPAPRRGQAGLFHTAILFDDEPGLAATVASIAAHAPGTYAGSADHLVSKAFYFTDPEGNGIELYWDRSRDLWGWQNGQVTMDSLPLDPNEFLREHLTDVALEHPDATGAVVGHVHLQVGDVPTAREFYVDALGFEATAQFHGALFVSAGGYHHHLAVNTWNSAGAGPRASALGLGEVSIQVPTADDVAALTARLARHGVAVRDDGAMLSFEDPWRNLLKVTVEH